MAKAKLLTEELDETVKTKEDLFLKKLNSDMSFKSDFSGNSMHFDWLDQLEFACPYIDNVIRKPKLALIREEETVRIEKSKKITVASIKDLSRHTNNISKFDKKTNSVQPEKILNIRNEETFNIYENKFLYTLIYHMSTFLAKREEELKNFELNDNKLLEYIADTTTDSENVSIELKISSESFPSNKMDKKLRETIKNAKARIKRIKEYISSWHRSDVFKELDNANVSLINPPIKKTNIILKNPNFQIAVKLWDYLMNYDNNKEGQEKNLDNDGNDIIKSFLDHSFLIDYFVFDSISKTRKEQKEKLSKYAVLMITQEIHRTMSLLLNCGIKITDEELLEMIAREMKSERNNRLVGVDDVKKKFKSAMDEYLERTQEYL